MTLATFLSAQTNSHAKEELFNYRLLYDVKLAAASIGYHLLTYSSDVDHDGYDIVLDDRVVVRKLQLKTVAKGATTSWNIHKHVLRPSRGNWERFGFDLPSIASAEKDRLCGVEGGVILMEYEIADGILEVEYWYSDVYVVTAVALGQLSRDGRSTNAAERIREELPAGEPNETVSVPKGMFVRAATPERLLALANMSNHSHVNWQSRVLILSAEKWGPKGDLSPEAIAAAEAETLPSMQKACGHADL